MTGSFQVAHDGQLDWCHALMVEEAQAGHFDARLAEPVHAARLRRNLASIIRDGRRLDENLRAQLLIWVVDRLEIGALINTEIVPGAGNELWMVAVRRPYRGAGHGGRMLDAALANLTPSGDVFARCYLASATMYAMFARRGFVPVEFTPEGAHVLKRTQDGTLAPVPGTKDHVLRPWRLVRI